MIRIPERFSGQDVIGVSVRRYTRHAVLRTDEPVIVVRNWDALAGPDSDSVVSNVAETVMAMAASRTEPFLQQEVFLWAVVRGERRQAILSLAWSRPGGMLSDGALPGGWQAVSAAVDGVWRMLVNA